MGSAETGKLLKFNPKTKELTTLIDNLVFANGVTLSHNEDFILVVGIHFPLLFFTIEETGKYRIHRYWLKGSKGKEEVN